VIQLADNAEVPLTPAWVFEIDKEIPEKREKYTNKQ
jgi:hypothetical protein